MSKTLDRGAISKLQDIRRANNAILGCSQILHEHDVLKECTPGRLGAYLQLTPQQACGLMFAIEACARFTDELFTNYLEGLGVGWTDEHLPEVRKEAEARDQLIRREIGFDEYKDRLGMDPAIQ